MRIEEGLSLFVRQLHADGRSQHTIDQYTRHVRLLKNALREHRLEEITPDDLARFLTSKSVTHTAGGRAKKASSMNALRSSVRTFFAYIHAAAYVPSNAARLIRRARCETAPPRALTEQDQKRLLDALTAGKGWRARRDHALFALMLATGIRLSSALAVRVEDIDLELGELRLQQMKGDRQDVVYLPRRIVEHLRAFLAAHGHGDLFVGSSGDALCGRHVQRRLSGWSRAAGITRRVKCHDLRHSFAIDLYEQTHDLLLVRQALHHQAIASTLVYARISQRRLRSALCE